MPLPRLSRDDLSLKTKLQLRSTMRDLGIGDMYDNTLDPPDLIELIEARQDEIHGPAAAGGGDSDEAEAATGMVRVTSGASSENFEVAGQTVAAIQKQLRDVLNIGDKAVPRVNGKEVAANYVLQDGETLEFVKPSGSKSG